MELLTRLLLKSLKKLRKNKRRNAKDLRRDFDVYNVRKYAVLIDKTSKLSEIPRFSDLELVGYFTFSLELADSLFDGVGVKLLTYQPKPPESDAWLLATHSKVNYALSEYLFKNHREEQVILRLYDDYIVSMYSYVDFFNGETQSILYLTNYFERTHNIQLPINIRYILKDSEGRVIKAGQRIIPPNWTVMFDSEKMDIPRGQFRGYLEIYADVRILNNEITPFYHMYIDYHSKKSIASIHQAGLGVCPANIPFYRSVFPEDREQHLVISAFNKVNKKRAIRPIAKLQYVEDGVKKAEERRMNDIPHQHMIFQDMNELFGDVLEKNIKEPKLTITPSLAMHRPNNYIKSKDTEMSWLDVEHGANHRIQDPNNIFTKDELLKFKKFGSYPWKANFPILPKQTNIDTIVMYNGDSASPFNDFIFIFYDQNGKKVFEKKECCSNYTIINLTEYMFENKINIDSGLLSIVPDDSVTEISRYAHFKIGAKHKDSFYIATYGVGGSMFNPYFDFEGGFLWKHPNLPIVNSEQFVKVVTSEEFDTYFTITNTSSMFDYKTPVKYDIELYTWNGKLYHFEDEILASTSKTYFASDFIKSKRIKSEKDYYSLWINCCSTHLLSQSVLHRKKDNAISLEHFYFGRFNIGRFN